MKNRGEEVEPVKKNISSSSYNADKISSTEESRTKPGQNSPKKINYLLVRILQ